MNDQNSSSSRLPQLAAAHKAYSQRQVYDGKRMRKAITRRTVDYTASILRMFEERALVSPVRLPILPAPAFVYNYLPPIASPEAPLDSIPLKHVRTSVNKVRCPINIVRFTPDGKRAITGAATGELTLWSGLSFNFETIMQAHDAAIRAMTWSHDSNYMLTGDHAGVIKYWQPSMNNIKVLQAHAEPVRNICFAPGDTKFASCSDDGNIRVWDFGRAEAERTLTGHGWDVKALDWHPSKALLASGSKDNLIKLWDPRSGSNLATLHGHKNSILDLRWNRNGHWMVTSGKDQLIKVFDIRTLSDFVTFRGHRKEINTLAWHPIHETLFSSASGDGTIAHWLATGAASTSSDPIALLEGAHDNIIWSLDWHPMGHVLASGSADASTRFWTRQRPADPLADIYNLGRAAAEAMGIRQLAPAPDDDQDDYDEPSHQHQQQHQSALPGLGLFSHHRRDHSQQQQFHSRDQPSAHHSPPPPPPPPSFQRRRPY